MVHDRLTGCQADVARYAGEVLALQTEWGVLNEQLQFYKEHIDTLKASPVCLLHEYANTKKMAAEAKDRLDATTSLLTSTESIHKDAVADLRRAEIDLAKIDKEIQSYGRLYRISNYD
jgi:chromosome segregation ATPase